MKALAGTKAHILAILDGSARNAAVLAEAAELAAGLDAQVILLRVVRPPRSTPSEPSDDLLPPVDRAERMVRAELRAQAAALPGLPVTRIVLVGARPVQEIIGWLRAHPVDFVVMATEGKRGLHRLIGGSIAEAMQRIGLAPVILISDHDPAPKRRATARTGRVGALDTA